MTVNFAKVQAEPSVAVHNLLTCQKLDPDCCFDTGDKLPDTNSELATIFENCRSDL